MDIYKSLRKVDGEGSLFMMIRINVITPHSCGICLPDVLVSARLFRNTTQALMEIRKHIMGWFVRLAPVHA